MMTTLSPVEIREKGYKALRDALGVVGMIRFLHQFDHGSGDYTEERDELYKEKALDTVVREIQDMQDRARRGNARE